ncbi:NALCN channel auxiliary factor 1 [Hemiscyllium ocellatum]|uniref:NALCN channel auxiliary factor 1 n=1 Tax=Hemiscyllium ocellatum TaxID=170820 RepID=UPI002966E9BC|nr:NALCN channel auxiliary factor 1 [Hemiscyllium ocellatum]
MTRGAWMCRQQGDGLQIWYVPRQSDKPCTDSERAQKWRLSLASLLFFTVLLSDHLWLCAEANLTGIRDQEQGTLAKMGGERTDHLPSPVSPRPEQPSEASSSSGKHTIFIGNITARPSWQLETCYPHCLTDQCFIVEDAESICGRVSERLSRGAWSFSNFHLAFCESYTLSELFAGMPTPEGSNCHLNVVMDGDAIVCVRCVETYQRLDQHAQEKYEEFQVLFQKYLHSGEYSVKSCIQDCKAVYKAWLCSQYFEATQFHCSSRIPCKQYCLEVQTRCPFVLPDNEDLVYGGLPSFLCTELPNSHPTTPEQECCDVRWELHSSVSNKQSKGTRETTNPPLCHRSSLASSVASKLCNSRLKLCVLVLILLHTVVTVSATQTSTGLDFGGLATWEDNSTSDE